MKKLSIVFALLAGCGGGSSSNNQGQEPTTTNNPPQISAFASQSADEGMSFSLTANASDNDGAIAAYQWVRLSGPSVSLEGTEEETVSFDAPTIAEDEIIRLEVTVTDNNGASSSAAVDITIVNTHIETRVVGKVTLGGEPVPGVDIVFDYGDIHHATQASAAGEYEFELAVPVGYGSTPFRVTAATDKLLLKKVGLIDELLMAGNSPLQQSPGTLKPTAQQPAMESQPLGINEVTTVEAALLQDLFDSEDAFLSNLYRSLQEYSAQYAHIDSRALLDIAMFILYLLDNGIAPPEPLNLDTLQEMLVQYHQDIEDFADVLWDNYAGKVFDLNAGPEAFERILGGGGTLIPVIESAPGTVRVGEWFHFTYSFEPDGALLIRNFYGEEIHGTWAQEGNAIKITTEQPFNALPKSECDFLSESETWTVIQERQLAMDSIMIARDVRYSCEGELRDEYTRYHPVALYRESHFLPILESDLADATVAIHLPGDNNQPDYAYSAYLLHFSGEGSGEFLDTGQAFSWEIADNILSLSLPDGGSTSIHKVQDDGRAGAGIVQIYKDVEGTEFVHHGLLFKAAPSLRLEEEDLISKGLRSGVETSRSTRDISLVTKDFCNFHEGGLRTCVYAISIDGEPFRGESPEDGVWAINQEGKLMLPQTTTADSFSVAEGDERCDPDTNADCWVYGLTAWEIIHREEDRYYVRTSGGWQFERPEDNQTLPITSYGLDFFDVSELIEIPEGM